MPSLKEIIVGSCNLCNKSGFQGDTSIPCECLIRFRIYNRLVSAGFSKKTIDFICSKDYDLPVIEKGDNFLDFFVQNPSYVEEHGMSLYLYSKERGRGKTTLAHYIMYKAVQEFSKTENYSTSREYAFQNMEDFVKDFISNDPSEVWKSTWYVLDDLGNENKGAWKKDVIISALQQVFHYRQDKGLPTIVTSNYFPGNLSVLYKGELDSLLELQPTGDVGGSIFRGVLVGGGEDFRLNPVKSPWPD